ncbi:hypothetical protein LTR22_028050, partial [Elasticomyces elasticus]
MPKSFPRPSVPRLDKCFPWSGKKESDDAGVIHEIDARALENPGWRQDTANAEDIHLTPTSSTHELAVFLRTTGPRGRESHRAPFSIRRRSKSLPRRLLGQLRDYWKLTPDDDVLSSSSPYTWDERLQAWVRGDDKPQQSSLAMSDSVVQRATSKGSHKYMELKVPSISLANGVFSIGRDCNEKPLAAELDLLTFRDLTSDELMDGWLAELRDKVDSCSESAGQESPPQMIASLPLGNLPQQEHPRVRLDAGPYGHQPYGQETAPIRLFDTLHLEVDHTSTTVKQVSVSWRTSTTKETNRRMSSIKQVQDLEKQLSQAKQQIVHLRTMLQDGGASDLETSAPNIPTLQVAEGTHKERRPGPPTIEGFDET